MTTIFRSKDNKFTILARTEPTHIAFKHVAELIYNDNYELATTKICYLNRTWERYEYQSVCRKVINVTIEDRCNQLYNEYKLSNNITKLSATKKQEIAENDSLIGELREFLKEINEK